MAKRSGPRNLASQPGGPSLPLRVKPASIGKATDVGPGNRGKGPGGDKNLSNPMPAAGRPFAEAKAAAFAQRKGEIAAGKAQAV